MTTASALRRDMILEAMPGLADALAGERGACGLEMAAGRIPVAEASLSERWLRLEFALPGAEYSVAALWEMLAQNGVRPGVKYVAHNTGRGVVPQLRGELLLTEDEPRLRRRLAGLFEDLRWAWEACVRDVPRGRPHDAGPPLDAQGLSELCVEAGWPAVAGKERALSIRLDGSRFGCQARFEPAGAAMALTAEWGICEAMLAPNQEHALAAYLLTASGAIRLAAVGCLETGGGQNLRTVGTRVALPRDASAEEVGHALAALAVACRMCGPETALLLEDHDLAWTWMNGWSGITACQ